MREPIRDRGRLEHIMEAIGCISDFVANNPLEEMPKDKILYFGLVKCVEIIGEAAYKLSPQFKAAHPETSWNIIEKMRHVLVHGYYQVNPEDVFSVIQNDLNPLREQIYRYLNETDWDKWNRQEQGQ